MSEEHRIPPAPAHEDRNHIVKLDYIRNSADPELFGYNLISRVEQAFVIKAKDLLWIDVDGTVSDGRLVYHYSSQTFFGVESIDGFFEKLVILFLLIFGCLFR